MSIDDTDWLREVQDLERTAEWRLRQVDADPSDHHSAAAARQLQTLAEELRLIPDDPLFTELRCMCNWLGESDGLSDFQWLAEDFRKRLGFGVWAADARSYLRVLVELAKETLGTG